MEAILQRWQTVFQKDEFVPLTGVILVLKHPKFQVSIDNLRLLDRILRPFSAIYSYPFRCRNLIVAAAFLLKLFGYGQQSLFAVAQVPNVTVLFSASFLAITVNFDDFLIAGIGNNYR